MEYRRFDQTVVARLDKGEEILSQLEILAEKEHIELASVQALGAVNDFTVGVFDPVAKSYASNRFEGKYEIVSLTGTVDRMEGKFYTHIHMSAGDSCGKVFGGHLNRAVVSATCELVLHLIPGRIDRKFSQEVGLNLISFPPEE